MRIRPYTYLDFPKIQKWIKDERTYAMWCANLIPYPLEAESFHDFFDELLEIKGDIPFVATTDDGEPIGFFSYMLNYQTNSGFFKFVMIDSSKRGHGYGTEMMKLAVKYAFDITGAEAVDLIVFSSNERAKRCYEKAGFIDFELLENEFIYKDEMWKRCKMRIKR